MNESSIYQSNYSVPFRILKKIDKKDITRTARTT